MKYIFALIMLMLTACASTSPAPTYRTPYETCNALAKQHNIKGYVWAYEYDDGSYGCVFMSNQHRAK